MAAAVAVVVAWGLAKMKSSGKIIGIILVGVGAVLILAVVLWLLVAENLSRGGAALGLILALILAAPLIGGGVFVLIRGAREDKAMAQVAQQRKLLSLVKTQGQVSIGDVALELGATFDQVKTWIYDLVGKGLFSGYINWDNGILYSQQASQLRDETRCKQCGGALSLAGKGVVRCPYCGTEYFLN